MGEHVEHVWIMSGVFGGGALEGELRHNVLVAVTSEAGQVKPWEVRAQT